MDYQIRDGGIIAMRSMQEALNYLVAPGYTVMIIIPSTMEAVRKTCYSPYEPPKVEQYDIVQRKIETEENEILKRLTAMEERLAAMEGKNE